MKMNKRKIKLREKISFSFPAVALFALSLLLDKTGGITACFISAALHEVGHLFAMELSGYPAEKIKIRIFGGEIVKKNQISKPLSKELFIIYGGIISNLLFAFTFGGLYYFLNNDFLKLLCFTNLGLGFFNLMPACTIDGGMGLEMLLSNFFGADFAAKAINVLTVLLIIPIFTLGFIVLFNSPYNFSLLFIGIYLTMSLFISGNNKSEKFST